MWRRCVYWFGVALIGVALMAVPSVAIVPSYMGGSAVDGFVEDGRYFVAPGHGQPIAEVSGSAWRAAYWVERLWPWSALVPGLTGLFLTGAARKPDWRPTVVPPAEPPPWVLWLCLAGAWVTLAGAGLCWALTRAPWAAMLVGWVLAFASAGTVGRLYSRSLRRPSAAEPDDPPDTEDDLG